MDKKTLTSIVVVLVVIVGGIFIYKNAGLNQINSQESAQTTESSTDRTSGALRTSSEKDFTVTGSNFSFSLKEIKVKKGDTVKITFVNSGGTHDFRIDEFNVATKKIQGGTQEVVTFVVDKEGSFEYYCSVGSHRAMGMKGTLVVE